VPQGLTVEEQAELALLDRLRAQLDAGSDIKHFDRLDVYAKWLLGTVALIAAAAAAVSYTATAPATGFGQQLFIVAQLSSVTGLVLAAASLVPRLYDFNPNNVESMQRAVRGLKDGLRTKRTLVAIGGALFVIALATAAISPLFVGIPAAGAHGIVDIHGSRDSSGNPTIRVELSGLLPHRETQMLVASADSSGNCVDVLYATAAVSGTDEKGRGTLTALRTRPGRLCVRAIWGLGSGKENSQLSGEITRLVELDQGAVPLSTSYASDADGKVKITVAAAQLSPGSRLQGWIGRFSEGTCAPAPNSTQLGGATADWTGNAQVVIEGRAGAGACIGALVTDSSRPSQPPTVWPIDLAP
jgi:flagellar biogenesis protein FliO